MALAAEPAGLLDEVAELRELGAVEADPGAAVEHDQLVVARQCGEEVGELDDLAVDAHLHSEVEPVVAAGVVRAGGLGVGDRERDERVAGRLAQLRCIAGDLHGHLAPVPQPRNDLAQQQHRIRAPPPELDVLVESRPAVEDHRSIVARGLGDEGVRLLRGELHEALVQMPGVDRRQVGELRGER